MFSSTLRAIALLSVLAPLVPAAHIKRTDLHRRHDELAHSSPNTTHTLEKRQSYTNARMTYYADGLGACGVTNQPSDYIVALDSILYDEDSHCEEWITISYNGKTAQAQIMDRCPGCPQGGLDLSTGLFTYFADESVGVIYADWWFNSGSGGGASTTTSSSTEYTPTSTYSPPPETTTSSEWTPTTTSWTPTSTSTTWTPSSSSTWSSSSSSSSSAWSSSAAPSSSVWSSSSAAASSASSSASAPSSSASAVALTAGNQLELINQAVVGLAGLLVAGAEAK